ncbi:MAG TPA: GNAT family N-acetyltransferase [Polyangia bacterium]|nr:GNAT family N-acetyltransferase [Polyangia bacterium]
MIAIGRRRVGPGAPVYFIAEAGSNHDGRLEQARQLIDLAVEAGADAVKFQAFTAASLYPKSAGQSEYLKDSRSIYDIIRDLEMPLDWVPVLAAYCAERGVDFLCTPFDFHSADVLEPYVPAFKIASYDMTNYPLLQHVARKGKPIIVSTGTANMDEVRDMIAAVRAVGDPGLVVLQCTAKYPAPLSALNLRTVSSMAALGVLTGLSDHSREPLPGPMTAVALGAVVIEKHFTLSNKLPGPDHVYALEPHELKDVVAKMRQVEQTLGSGDKTVHPEEQELRAFARRSIFTTRALPEGERLRRADLSLLRCGHLPYGLHPKEYLRLVGRRLRRGLGAETAVRGDDVEPLRIEEGDLSLRPMEERDLVHAGAWLARPEAAGSGFSSGAGESASAWFSRAQLRTDRIDLVIEKAGVGPVGFVGLSEIDLAVARARFDLLLADVSGRDELGERAARLALNYAFQALELRALEGTTDAVFGVSLRRQEAPQAAAISLTARAATAEDAAFVWRVNNHPTVRAQSVKTADIPWETHLQWYRAQLSRPSPSLMIGVDGEQPVGVARFDVSEGEAVISVAVLPEARGVGAGRRLIRLVTDQALARADVRAAVAYSRPDNVASQRAFLAAGYSNVGPAELAGIPMVRLVRRKGQA